MKKQYQAVTAEEAVKVIKSGDHVHISSVSNVPQCLVKALCDRGRAGELKNVYIHHLHTEGAAPYVNPEFEGIFQHNAFFVGANVRESVQKGLADYIPVFLGETSKLYREQYIKCNVAMIQVCPPDKFGYVSLGPSVDATLAAMESAEFTIAVVNKHVPRTHGDALIHISKINYFVEDNTPLLTVDMPVPNEVEKTIGRYCAELIEDGACLQMGIGSIPNAILSCLHNHKDIGIHTEMFSDGILPLIKKGVITGNSKKLDKGKIVSTFVMGSQKIYNFIDGNPEVLLKRRGIHQRSLRHCTAAQDDLHQLGHTSRPVGSSMRRLIGRAYLFRRWRANRLCLRCFALQGRQGHHRHAFHNAQRHQQDCPRLGSRFRCRYHTQPHPLVHHGIWCSRPIWQVVAGKGQAHHLCGTSTVSGAAGRGRLQALRATFPLPLE